jgi:uncharacterized metal-binding protein YceD (DUF177 family)
MCRVLKSLVRPAPGGWRDDAGIPMKPLGLKFRLDELPAEGRAFKGELTREVLDEALAGVVGDLGYRCLVPAAIKGSAYLSGGTEVILQSRLTAEVGFDCVRCLEPRVLRVDLRRDHVLVQRKDAAKPVVVVDSDEEQEDEVEVFRGDEINLSDLYRQELLVELPMNPSCAHIEGATCTEFEQGATALEAQVDPRWAKLLELKKNMN